MGFFSWVTSDTNRSIANSFANRVTFPVYLLQPNSKPILEEHYEGYGVFGGEDVYALVARWNVPERCNGDDDHDRDIGIEIACYDEQNANLKYPIKLVENVVLYKDAQPSINCPQQGFFYDGDDDYTDEGYSNRYNDDENDDENYLIDIYEMRDRVKIIRQCISEGTDIETIKAKAICEIDILLEKIEYAMP